MILKENINISAAKKLGIFLEDSIETGLSLDRDVALLGYLNACAAKGRIDIEEDEVILFNSIIYDFKNKIIEKMLSLYPEYFYRDKEKSCIYYRTFKGVQISFHLGWDLMEDRDFMSSIEKLPLTKWDKVVRSYRYVLEEKEKEYFAARRAARRCNCFSSLNRLDLQGNTLPTIVETIVGSDYYNIEE